MSTYSEAIIGQVLKKVSQGENFNEFESSVALKCLDAGLLKIAGGEYSLTEKGRGALSLGKTTVSEKTE